MLIFLLALKLDTKCGLVKVVLKNISTMFKSMVRDDTLAKIKDVDFNTKPPSDVTYVDRLMQAAEKRWVKYAGPKPVIDEPIESTVKFDLNLRKFSYDGLAESLLIIYNSNSISDVRDGEINLPEIMKVGHSVKAIKDIVIEPVDNKSRKRKKSPAFDINRDNKQRRRICWIWIPDSV